MALRVVSKFSPSSNKCFVIIDLVMLLQLHYFCSYSRLSDIMMFVLILHTVTILFWCQTGRERVYCGMGNIDAGCI